MARNKNFNSSDLIIICSNCAAVAFPLFRCQSKHINCKACYDLNNGECSVCSIPCSLLEVNDRKLDNATIRCNSCQANIKYSELQVHFDSCSDLKVACKNCGFMVLRSSMESHRSAKCHIDWTARCPFGCITSSGEDLKKHREENFNYHLNIVYSTLKYYGLDRSLKLPTDGREGSFGLHQDLMKDETNDLSELKSLTEEISDLKTMINLKRMEKKEQMRLLEASIDVALLTSFDGVLVWMWDENIRESLENESPVFYSGKYGYKLQLIITKVEDGLDIWLVFLDSAFDPILPQAFTAKISLKYWPGGVEKPLIDNQEWNLNRADKKSKIATLKNSINIEWIKFVIDCSEFDIASVD